MSKTNVLKFTNLNYTVVNQNKKDKRPRVQILDDLSGFAESGKITSVMGTSGCGKTHLLKLLVGDIESDSTCSGKITYNDQIIDPIEWLDLIAYLPQESIYYPELTVYETLIYYLKFNKKESSKSLHELAMEILTECCIAKKKDALFESLSGGERKRAMISLALTKEPEIVFLDEPTSGLDSLSAMIIISNLKKYAVEKNRIVLTTLHQPGTAIFAFIDHLIFMVPCGLFYSGPVTEVPRFLETNGIVVDENVSLSEFLFLLNSGEIPEYQNNLEQIVELNRNQVDTSCEVDKFGTCYPISSEFKFSHVINLFMTQLKIYFRKDLTIIQRIANIIFPLYALWYIKYNYSSHIDEFAHGLQNLSINDLFNQMKNVILNLVMIYSILFAVCKPCKVNNRECHDLEIITGKYSYASYVGYVVFDKVVCAVAFFSYTFLIQLIACHLFLKGAKYILLPGVFCLINLLFACLFSVLSYSFYSAEKPIGFISFVLSALTIFLPLNYKLNIKTEIGSSISDLLPSFLSKFPSIWCLLVLLPSTNLELFFYPDHEGQEITSLLFGFKVSKWMLGLFMIIGVAIQVFIIYKKLKSQIMPKVRSIKNN